MKIVSNAVVAFDYTLTDDEGEVLDSSDDGEPLTYLHGHGQIVPGLERAMEGHTAGDSLKAVVTPKDGYGDRNVDRVVKVPRTELPEGEEPEVGMELGAVGPNGEVATLWIIAVEKDDVLVSTDLRGVESHGVSNMLRHYIADFQSGAVNPRPQWTVVREALSAATIDGGGGLGVIQGPRAMRMAIAKARQTGVGVVTMRNSGHLGAVGQHAMLAARAEMIGVCMCGSWRMVLPTFGAAPRLGTNPLAIAAPAGREPFLLFDAATSSVAANKITLAQRIGANIAPGWIADGEGRPIVHEQPVPSNAAYHLLPLGGTREGGSHKGYGLGLMVEVLSSLLAGSLPSMVAGVTS